MTSLSPNTPTNYDNSYIAVTPEELENAVTALSAAADDIGDDLNAIFNCLNSLKLSWVGQASATADELMAQWTASVAKLVGTGPATGVVNSSAGDLNTLIRAVDQVANTYASTEQSILNMFQSMYQQLVLQGEVSAFLAASPAFSGPAPSTTYTPITDDGSDAPYYTTSVNET